MDYVSQPKYKSPYFWAGIVSILLIVMGNYGLYDVIKMPEGTVRLIIDLFFTAIGWFGVWNDSGNKNKF